MLNVGSEFVVFISVLEFDAEFHLLQLFLMMIKIGKFDRKLVLDSPEGPIWGVHHKDNFVSHV